MKRVLIVDESSSWRSLIDSYLTETYNQGGERVTLDQPADRNSLLTKVSGAGYDLVLADLHTLKKWTLDDLQDMLEQHPGMPVYILSTDIEAAKQCAQTLDATGYCDKTDFPGIKTVVGSYLG